MRDSLVPSLSSLRLCRNMKKNDLLKRERRLGEKDLDRLPLAIQIHAYRPHENIRLYNKSDDSHNLKDPHSKSLEPDCLSDFICDYDTVSPGREKGCRKISNIFVSSYVQILSSSLTIRP